MGIVVPLNTLAVELRRTELDAELDDAGRLVVVLPSSSDRLVIKPSGLRSALPQLLWERRSFLDTPTGARGFLDWTDQLRPLVSFVYQTAFSLEEVGPQYQIVIDTLKRHGLWSVVVRADAGGHQIRVEIRPSWRKILRPQPTTFLLIGAPHVLPARLDQVKGWHAELHTPDGTAKVAYDSLPADPEQTSWHNSSPTLMAEYLADYVRQMR